MKISLKVKEKENLPDHECIECGAIIKNKHRKLCLKCAKKFIDLLQ